MRRSSTGPMTLQRRLARLKRKIRLRHSPNGWARPTRRLTLTLDAIMAGLSQPHPEEHRRAMHLEGWAARPGLAAHPSRRALWALLRMRLEDFAPKETSGFRPP